MFTLKVEIEFIASHFLSFTRQPDEPLHEHKWRVRAVVASNNLNSNYLVMDFHKLENYLHQITVSLTNLRSINELAYFSGKSASTELIACYIYEQLAPKIPNHVTLKEICLWETPTCQACYKP